MWLACSAILVVGVTVLGCIQQSFQSDKLPRTSESATSGIGDAVSSASELNDWQLGLDEKTPYRIEITGSEDRWIVQYPGLDCPLESAGDLIRSLELHVPTGREILLSLRSTDYIYTMELPNWQLKEIAVPKLEFQLRFTSGSAGRFELLGDHLCGGVVEELQGTLVVESAREVLLWLKKGQCGHQVTSANRITRAIINSFATESRQAVVLVSCICKTE